MTWDPGIVRAFHSARCGLCDELIVKDQDFIEVGHEWVHVECADGYWIGSGFPYTGNEPEDDV